MTDRAVRARRDMLSAPRHSTPSTSVTADGRGMVSCLPWVTSRQGLRSPHGQPDFTDGRCQGLRTPREAIRAAPTVSPAAMSSVLTVAPDVGSAIAHPRAASIA